MRWLERYATRNSKPGRIWPRSHAPRAVRAGGNACSHPRADHRVRRDRPLGDVRHRRELVFRGVFAFKLGAILAVAERKRVALRAHWLDVAIVVLTMPRSSCKQRG
jgi:hypothetical protein